MHLICIGFAMKRKESSMIPNPSGLMKIAGITSVPIAFYDAPHNEPFEPFATASNCIFSAYQGWMRGESLCLTPQTLAAIGCPGAGYWNCNIASAPSEDVAQYLAGVEGLKASTELMCRWLKSSPPFQKKNEYVVIGPLRMSQYEFVKTITFFVNPDQLSLLLTGAEYQNGVFTRQPVMAKYGSGCGLLAASLEEFDTSQAMIGATDIAMRLYLPPETLAFTVTKPMFEQLCDLDESSFLHKSYWGNLSQARLDQHISG
jgi:hypothetical protein